MLSLSLVHWLIISNVFMLLSLTVVVVRMQMQQKKKIERMASAISNIEQTQTSITQSTLGMGRRIQQINESQQQEKQRILLPHADEAMLTQATRLVQLGANANELVESCGVPRAEAELLVSLRSSNAYMRH